MVVPAYSALSSKSDIAEEFSLFRLTWVGLALDEAAVWRKGITRNNQFNL